MTNESKYQVSQNNDKLSGLDPHLEAIADAAKAGQILDKNFVHELASEQHVVDVIAKVKDPNVAVPGLKVITSVRNIITGTVLVEEIEAVAQHDNILKLEGPKRVYGDLHDSVREIRARAKDLQDTVPVGSPVPDGSGVIVGIVDFGCDFLHQNFRNADGSTRILFFWDQNRPSSPQTPSPQPYGYGREISQTIINQALDNATAPPSPSDNPFHPEDFNNGAYQFLGYRPSIPNRPPAHGTHVMDIAAGNGRGSDFPGVAPGADLIFVDLGGGNEDEATESFGNSKRLLEAVDYIFRKANEMGRPAVVNMSLGTHGGPHDGTTPAEQHFDGLLDEPNRAIVLSAGNSHQRKVHASGAVSVSQPRDLTWQIRNTVKTDNELEVWYEGNANLEATLVDPDGDKIGPFLLGVSEQQVRIAGQVVIKVNHRKDEENRDNHLDIYMLPSQALLSGNWQLQLRSKSSSQVTFHAWIERVGARVQSRFALADADPAMTIGSISCGHKTIAVGAYNARGLGQPLASFTSEGPTRDGRQKPEVSAPGGELGDGVLAAHSLTHTLRTDKAGTSMAAPHVTGLIALLMQISNSPLTIDEIRNAVMKTARHNQLSGSLWHPRYGVGRVDAREAVRQMTSDVVSLPTVVPQSIITENHNGAVVSPGKTMELVEGLTSIAMNSRVRVRMQIEVEPCD